MADEIELLPYDLLGSFLLCPWVHPNLLGLSDRTNSLLNTVGCGDALLAGLVVAIKQGRVVEDCARLAVACGTANLSVAEPGRFDPYLVQEIYKKVEIVRLAV